ncbi:replication initiation protein [Thiocystis violacea]|uniref:replication initiation protein n=1 Tax=Thiocystis violacea TaxID=13725 RepID=UPI001906166C|nr:replication initiation protein [Thiocystis violacea]
MDLLEQTLFYKPTGTVQIANNFTLIERKILNAIIWHSQKHKFKPGEHALPIRDVFHLIGLDSSRNQDVLKDAIRSLVGTVVEWNILGADRVDEWGVCTFLASGVIRNGKLQYILNPKIVEKINQPTLYAKIQLLVQSQIRKRHALVLYEFFLDALSRLQKTSVRVVVPVVQVYELLSVNTEMGYKFFNRDVIKPSLAEITKHTDVEVTYEANKDGRRVVELVFNVKKKDSFQLSLDFDSGRLDHVEKLEEARSANRVGGLQALLEHYGVGKRKAQALIKTYDDERIRGNIEKLLQEKRSGKTINNVPAYLVKAIEEDYRPKPSPKEQEEEQARRKREAAAKKKKEREALKAEWERFRMERTREYFAKQPPEWQEEKRQTFLKTLEGEGSSDVVRASLRKNGFESPMVQGMFFTELREELLTRPEELEFEKYVDFQKSKNS